MIDYGYEEDNDDEEEDEKTPAKFKEEKTQGHKVTGMLSNHPAGS